MSDPRNVAHQKRVSQEKHHQKAKPPARFRTGKRPPETQPNQSAETALAPSSAEDTKEKQAADLEKSLAVLSKLKDLEFHSRANIETLAELSLTVEEELKQREFSEAIAAIYSAEDAFHSKIAAFIETYQAKCEGLQKKSRPDR
jgi:hypothetical protein